MTSMNTQMGTITTTTYGTNQTVTKFFEFDSEAIKPERGRVESKALRSGRRVQGADRHMPYEKGAAGTIVMPVMSKGFGFWLVHLLGTVATTGPTDSNYTHTGTVGSLLGDHFTLQVNRPFAPSGTNQAFTFAGCKVASWEFDCDAEGLLMASLTLDAQNTVTNVALASASYPASMVPLSFVGGTVTIAAVQYSIKSIKVKGDNKLKVDRFYIQASGLKNEPLEADFRDYSFEVNLDFSDLTHYNVFASATAAGNLAAIIATFDGPFAHAGATLPELKITIPNARFDQFDSNVAGPDPLMQKLTGICTDDYTNSPVTIAYRTTDVTP